MMKKLAISIIFSTLLFSSESFNTVKEEYVKSYNYEQMGKYNEAIKVLSPLYNKYPNGYTLNLRFGWLFYLNKQYKSATKYYKKASLVNSNAISPKLGIIRIYLDTASFENAQTVSYEVIKKDYYNYYANLYITKALIAQYKYDVALKVVNKMLSLYPTDILYLQELAVIYKKTSNKKLQSVYENILILDPNNVFVRDLI